MGPAQWVLGLLTFPLLYDYSVVFYTHSSAHTLFGFTSTCSGHMWSLSDALRMHRLTNSFLCLTVLSIEREWPKQNSHVNTYASPNCAGCRRKIEGKDGLGMGSACKGPRTHIKVGPNSTSSNERQRQGNPWDFWSSSAPKSEGSRVNERPCLNKA